MQTTLMDHLQSDAPAGMTPREWRHFHAPVRPRRFGRLRRIARR